MSDKHIDRATKAAAAAARRLQKQIQPAVDRIQPTIDRMQKQIQPAVDRIDALQADPEFWRRQYCALAGWVKQGLTSMRNANRANASAPRSGGKLPEQAELLAEYERLIAQGKSIRDARSTLYARYATVTPKAIRDKIERAQKRRDT